MTQGEARLRMDDKSMPSKLTTEVWPVSNTSLQPGVENEDAVLTYHPPDPNEARFSGSLTVVAACRGGGGHGHVYTNYATHKVMADYYGSDEPDLGLRLENAFQAANLDLFANSQQRPEMVKASVSMVAVAIRGEAMSVAWVGDARAYLIHNGKAELLTRDHTLVQQLLDEGAVTPDEARDHPRRDVLLRSLGTQETIGVEVIDHRLHPDNAVVVCTSAMLRAMDDDDIASIVASKSPQNAAEMLVQQARASGSKETITVVAALLRDGAPPMISNPPFTWDRSLPSFDQQATLAMPHPAPPGQAAPEAGTTVVNRRVAIDRTSPAAQTQVSTRPEIMPQDLQTPPPMVPPALTPAAQQPSVEPAPPYQTAVQPAPPVQERQPVYPVEPPSQQYQAYPPQPPAYRPGGQPSALPGYAIDPITGLPPVPQGPGQPAGWGQPAGAYQPRYYQQPGQPHYAAPRRGPSIGTFAIVGVLAVLVTAIMLVVMINPFNLQFPTISARATDTPTATRPATLPPAAPTTPAAAVAQPTTQPQPTTQTTPPGMNLIAGGAFTRGVSNDEAQAAILSCIDEAADNKVCLPDYFNDAQPVADVTVSPFYMDITEVTNKAYQGCVSAGACTVPKNTEFYNDPGYANHPVVFVNWEQAGQYCQWAGKRLPYEAEWEKAARWDPVTKHSNIWPWGDTFESGRTNTGLAGQKGTAEVGKFAQDRSPWGILDMGGNVSEWTLDWYFKGYTGLPTLNPTGPANQPLTKPFRTVRGGSFQALASYARSGQRFDMPPQTAAAWIGFRCVLPVQGPVPTQTPATPGSPTPTSGGSTPAALPTTPAVPPAGGSPSPTPKP